MKQFIFLLILSLSVACETKEKPSFTLQGQIENPEHEYLLLLEESNIEKKETTFIDTLFLDEMGRFKAEFHIEPHFYRLIVNEKLSIPLVIDHGQNVQVRINSTDTKIEGSKDTDLLLNYEKFRASSLERLVKTIRRKITEENQKPNPNAKLIDSLGKLEIHNYDLHLEELNAFINSNMRNSLALYPSSIRWKGENNLAFYDSLVLELENANQNYKIIERLREKVTRLQQTSIGGTAPDIKMNTTEGNEKSLYALHDQYTLIEFWASWCGPCRRESPVLNELYLTYKDQGFNIYAVSLDDRERNWLHAIQKDQRTYTNVSSLEGFKTPAAYNYAVTALPMNFLIDKEGKIIAKDIHGEELISLVKELF
ncbi:TlpA family protein disulfide reductase [Brumimicrobium oceani]|uniref:Thioredoxin domain-containing protein n=1 Tax=Brumimicrobium oceani TaxID=2100725 RepID=A0A2U2XBG6_9FLAO|nr:TlpA disulfide reductase family protein [Brumimicrobium oceani]PWH85128.1 hypothetical protein DIT68_10860 [Brumimicrobium oceani]